jgi:hypothetical protein
MRSNYYPGACTKPGAYYQGWFMYMRYTGTEGGVLTIQEYILNQVLTEQIYLYFQLFCNIKIYTDIIILYTTEL